MNGWKTYIGAILYGLAAALAVLMPEYQAVWEVLKAIAGTLFGVGIAHKVVKLTSAAKGATKSLALLIGAAAIFATSAGATDITPYAALTLDRLSGPDEWSTGFEVGAEVTQEPVTLLASITNHDIVSEKKAYPWNSTFRVGAGVYDSGHSILGIGVTPYGLLILSRVSGPDRWSTGLSFGIELDFDPIWLRIAHDRNDVLTDERAEVYPWDSTTSLAAGIYFGGDGD